MKRFGGVMDSTSMEKEAHYYDGDGNSVIVQAGPEGWSVIFSDGTVKSGDVTDDTGINFSEAKKIAEEEIGCKLRISLDEPVQKV